MIKRLILLATAIILELSGIQSYQVNNNPFYRAELLDENYLLEWQIDWAKERVNFKVKVGTKGWVKFGLSNNGRDSGADVVIGGVKDGRAYFSDYHQIGTSSFALKDKRQDWTLNSAWESGYETHLNFSRAFDTCDNEDYAITLNRIAIVYAYGYDDNPNSFTIQQGIYEIYLLDPDYAPEIRRDSATPSRPTLITSGRNEAVPGDTQVWTLFKTVKIPSNSTSYLCSIHKSPAYSTKRHAIGFDVTFPNDLSRKHIHHINLYRCHAPAGFTRPQFFERHLANPGEACYNPWDTTKQIPNQYCDELYYSWSVGGRPYFLPNHLGFAFEEGLDYYRIQVHYDNPNNLENLQLSIQLDTFHTEKLRPNEGGILFNNHVIPGLPESFLVPPNSRNHRIFGHCSPECTRRIYGEDGMTITGLYLHSHNAGVGMRFRHFRDDKELPWILYDDNYNNLFQPTRHLKSEVRVLPGDQLTIECRLANNETTVGGYSTRQEMCSGTITYYAKAKGYSYCDSGISDERERYKILGIQNVSWIESELEWVVESPQSLKGLRSSQVSDNYVEWTRQQRQELQRFHEVATQRGGCHKDLHARTIPLNIGAGMILPFDENANTEDDFRGDVNYPFNAKPYFPPKRKCSFHV